MEEESIQIDVILNSISLSDIKSFVNIEDPTRQVIKALPIPQSQWDKIKGNVVMLETENYYNYKGRLIDVTADLFILETADPVTSIEKFVRNNISNVYAVATLLQADTDPNDVYEAVLNILEIAEYTCLYEVLYFKMCIRDEANKHPYYLINLITRILEKVPDRVEAALKQIGIKKSKDLLIIRSTLELLLNSDHKDLIIKKVIQLKRSEILDCLNEVDRQIALLNELPSTDHRQKQTSLSSATQKQNVFNRMSLERVEEWFMQLSTNISKNGEPFLKKEQVQSFIDQAFILNITLTKFTLNYAPGEKLALWKLFYQYYQSCVSVNNSYERNVQSRDRYIKLLTDHFTNFTFEEVRQNFGNKVKKNWNLPK
ncbi:hypothetical protein BH09BAC4_BH09BAC4_20720 [soil metagenome]